ncbi:MAG: ribosome assembly cofactor RimP [Bacteroidales bacterium]|nr:ribosome assembly cofactor RimP [Bacteroidales bacterium]
MIDKNKVQQCVEEWIQDKEYFLVEVSVDKNNKVIVEIDNKEGVWIDDCCDLSRFIEEHFDRDVEDFELEVGSAGIGQPFKVMQQYENNIGNKVEVLTEENKKLIGKLTAVTPESITIDDKTTLTFEEFKNVRVVIDFD